MSFSPKLPPVMASSSEVKSSCHFSLAVWLLARNLTVSGQFPLLCNGEKRKQTRTQQMVISFFASLPPSAFLPEEASFLVLSDAAVPWKEPYPFPEVLPIVPRVGGAAGVFAAGARERQLAAATAASSTEMTVDGNPHARAFQSRGSWFCVQLAFLKKAGQLWARTLLRERGNPSSTS